MFYRTYVFAVKTHNRKLLYYAGKHISRFPTPDDDSYLGSGLLINKIKKKYGSNCIIQKIWFDHKTETDMNNHECLLISNYKLTYNRRCLNIATGGEGRGLGWKTSESTKVKISNSLKGYYENNSHPMNGKHHSDTTKLKLSSSLVGRTDSEETRDKKSKARLGKPSPMLGKTHNADARHRISIGNKGRISEKRGSHWVYFDKLFELWLNKDKCGKCKFRKYAIAAGYPDISYQKMIIRFKEKLNELSV